jgi:hypothetical protein
VAGQALMAAAATGSATFATLDFQSFQESEDAAVDVAVAGDASAGSAGGT